MKIKLFIAIFIAILGISAFAAPQVTEEKAKFIVATVRLALSTY